MKGLKLYKFALEIEKVCVKLGCPLCDICYVCFCMHTHIYWNWSYIDIHTRAYRFNIFFLLFRYRASPAFEVTPRYWRGVTRIIKLYFSIHHMMHVIPSLWGTSPLEYGCVWCFRYHVFGSVDVMIQSTGQLIHMICHIWPFSCGPKWRVTSTKMVPS